MKKLVTGVAGLVLLWSLAGWAEAKDWGAKHRRGEITANYWWASYTGELKFEDRVAGIDVGQTLNLEDDLKLENPQGVPELVVNLRPTKRNLIHFSYFESDYQGENNHIPLATPLDFLGFHFTGDIKTKLGVNRLQGYYQFSPWATKRGYVGFLLGADYYFFDLKIESDTIHRSKEALFPMVIPVVGVSGQYTLAYGLGLFGQVSGVQVHIQNVDASYLDVLAGVQFKVGRLYSALGYQYLNGGAAIDLGSDKSGNFNLFQQGPLLTVGVNL